MRITLLFFLLLHYSYYTIAQNAWGKAVVAYQFGSTQTNGQTEPYFPNNILKGLGQVISLSVPASLPEDLCSLGRNGWITIKFDPPIINKPGKDFTVFENPFIYGNNLVYDEWIEVSVSKDSINFITFPHDTLTGSGFAGRTPTAPTGANYFNPAESGGDAFDLETVGLDTVYYVKLKDATRYQPPDRLGADVDGVLALHQANPLTSNHLIMPTHPLRVECQLSENRSCQKFLINLTNNIFIDKIELINLTGIICRTIIPEPSFNSIVLNKEDYSTGIYIVNVYHKDLLFTGKIVFN